MNVYKLLPAKAHDRVRTLQAYVELANCPRAYKCRERFKNTVELHVPWMEEKGISSRFLMPTLVKDFMIEVWN